MHDLPSTERARLERESTRLAIAERRTWAVTLVIFVALASYALAPLVPRSSHLLGAVTTRQSILFLLPGAFANIAMLFVYRRVGGESSVYRRAEELETFLIYLGSNLGITFGTQLTWPVLWILSPFSAMFFALTRPFDVRMYARIIGVGHALCAAAYVARGDASRAWIALGMGVVSYATYAVVAREVRRSVDVEAERNVARAAVDVAALDRARRELAEALREGIGREIAALSAALDGDVSASRLAPEADAVHRELEAITGPSAAHACTGSELRARIDGKCRALCSDTSRYESELVGDGDQRVEGNKALALLRIAQELVRNAIVHGRASEVRVRLAIERGVVLTVDDNGVGVTRDVAARGTGGLANARRWLDELGGALELREPPAPATRDAPTGARGSVFEATVP